MIKSVTILSLLSVLTVCCNTNNSGPVYDLKGYEVESMGGGIQLATYKDQNGHLVAKGQVVNGLRTGTWVTYHPASNKVKSITNYINGLRTGIEVSLNNRGQIEAMAEYKEDVLHGLKASYSGGHPTEEITYKDGIVDGPFAIYNNRTIQRKGTFLNGKQHGILEYFDDKGNVTLRYEYKNGEKITGGIVETVQPSTSE